MRKFYESMTADMVRAENILEAIANDETTPLVDRIAFFQTIEEIGKSVCKQLIQKLVDEIKNETNR